MEVIAVERVRRRMRLTIGPETLIVPMALYRERPLEAGDEVDLAEYTDWLLLREYRPALDYAVSLLSARAYAKGELRDKLVRAGYLPEAAEMAVYKLETLNLLDDGAFARQWAASRTRRGLGEKRIRMELRQKGLSAEDAEAALSETDPDERLAAAVRLAAASLRRAKPGEDPRKTLQRTTAALARRGYSFDLIREAIRRARGGD